MTREYAVAIDRLWWIEAEDEDEALEKFTELVRDGSIEEMLGDPAHPLSVMDSKPVEE